MSAFETGHAELVKAAEDIVNVDEEVQATLNQLRGTVETLSGAWAGSAAVAFTNMMERFNADADKLHKALIDIAEQMSGTAATYLQQDQDQDQVMSSISARLGGGA
jgi:WXG100 family type VII secretion target